LRTFEDILQRGGLKVHYLKGDLDHNRTVTAFSGEEDAVVDALMDMADAAFDVIDLTRHTGVHPRIGALDVCPFVPLDSPQESALPVVERFAALLAARHSVPVYLYEKSERGRHEADLPSLRKGGFGGLIGRILTPDFGPQYAHPRLGLTVAGVRDFLIAMNANLRHSSPIPAKEIARTIRRLRGEGDPRFLGVRSLGFSLASLEISQVSMNLTLPDLTPVDPIVDWIRVEASNYGTTIKGTELIGVIREKDLAQATHLKVNDEQIIRNF
jgi:glutamate formiminotransferase